MMNEALGDETAKQALYQGVSEVDQRDLVIIDGASFKDDGPDRGSFTPLFVTQPVLRRKPKRVHRAGKTSVDIKDADGLGQHVSLRATARNGDFLESRKVHLF